MAVSDEMQFAILGPSGAGKTTMLACMSEEFEEELPGAIFPAEADTFNVLNNAYNALKRAANDSSKREFENGISGTEDMRKFLFHIKGKRAVMPVRFYDFPGGWMSPNSPNNEKIIDIAVNSAVIIVAINTPYLMGMDGQYADQGCSVEGIERIIYEALRRDIDKDRLILFVPIKCEKWMETRDEQNNLNRAVRKAFANTLSLNSVPQYAGKLAMALLPIQTVGNAKFKRFKISLLGNVVEREVYRKESLDTKFSPLNVEQPIRYMMSFLLAQFAENRKKRSLWEKFFRTLFMNNGDLKEIAEYIRDGIKTDRDPEAGIEIVCGRELIGIPSNR